MTSGNTSQVSLLQRGRAKLLAAAGGGADVAQLALVREADPMPVNSTAAP